MRGTAKHFIVGGLDRALSARGFKGPDLLLARAELVDWARTRFWAARGQRGVAGGLRVVVTRPGRAELRPFDVVLPGPGELSVEMLVSAISPGTERAQWLRMPNAQPALPYSPGYSGAGRVLSAGPNLEAFKAGMLVAVPRTRHASVATVPAEWVTPVPAGVRLQDAALVYLAIIAGYGVRRAGSLAGEPVCVVGAGPIGALAQRLVTLQAPGPVTVVAKSRHREAAAMRAGATRFLTAVEPVDGIAAAAVIEATGDPDALRIAVAAARPGGTVVLLGSPRGVTPDARLMEIRRKRLRLVGAHVSALATEAKRAAANPFAQLSSLFLDAVASGRLDPSDLAGEPVDPREVGLLYRRLADGRVSAAHLDWTRVPRPERVRRRGVGSLPALRTIVPPFPGETAPAVRPSGRPLRFAVIGCGDIGFSNARAIAEATGTEVTLCHDPAQPLAEAAVGSFGGEVAASLEEALDPGRVDAAFLSVPHDLHAPLAVRAAQAGLHVVVEKPLAADLAGAEAAVAAAAAAGVELSVCFPYRYYRPMESARALVQAGALGRLRGVTVVFHADKPQSYWVGGFSGRATSNWRASRERAGGGVLIMNVAHYVDLVRYIAGGEAAWVMGVGRTDEGAEVEDAFALSVGFAGGAIGSFSGSASTRGLPSSRFELWGEVGTVCLEPDGAVYTERALEGVAAGRWTPLAHEDEDGTRRLFVERFAAAVRAGDPPDVTAADALAVQSFIDAAYRAIEEGQRVTLGAKGTVPA